MQRLLGLDTEYGLYVEGVEVGDLVEQARALVCSWPGVWAGHWDYSCEHPLRDVRGFKADKLAFDPQDARYERAPERPLSRNEERCDRALPNGARLYQDHGHPEYATPECRSVCDLVAHDQAGQRVLWRCAQAYQNNSGKRARLYKNNVDFHGMSYGAHENYLVRRDVPFEALSQVMLPFLVTRIVYAGAGKVGVEGHWNRRPQFQLSQRADFFSTVCSVDTLHRRPLLNTRDEPHAQQRLYCRLHVISGDANLCELATALKVGTTALVLDLLESGWTPPVCLKCPVDAIKALSRDLEHPLALDDGHTSTGVELQRTYLAAAQAQFSGRDEETDWVLAQWEDVLEGLSSDPTRLRDRLDWVAKRALLSDFLNAEGLRFDEADPELLQSLDLAYHDLDPQAGLFAGLVEQGRVQTLVSEEAIAYALEHGPRDTRACARGLCVAQLREHIEAITWSRVVFRHNGQRVVLPLGDVVEPKQAFELNELVQQPDALLAALVRKAQGAQR